MLTGCDSVKAADVLCRNGQRILIEKMDNYLIWVGHMLGHRKDASCFDAVNTTSHTTNVTRQHIMLLHIGDAMILLSINNTGFENWKQLKKQHGECRNTTSCK